MAEHALYTRDRAWFEHVSPALIEACDWVFRQRRQTMRSLPHSRGWEHGFLPAGALEDVREYRYWLTTNTMIWRGVDAAATALETCGHPEAARVRVESDAYREDLRRGFETIAVMWLRYMFVYGNRDGLYVGRAISRAWFAQDRPIGVENVRTRWWQASVTYLPAAARDTIQARVELRLANRPPRIRIRFRHPESKPIVGVTINGREHLAFDAGKQDVDLAGLGLDGPLEIVVRFEAPR